MQARVGSKTGSPGALLALLSCPVLVVLCVAFVDRPAASLSHADFAGHTAAFVALTHIVDPLPPLSGLGLAAAGLAAVLGWRPGRVGRTLLACCLAVLIAYAIKEQLKYAFGRLWPETWVDGNPSWIHDGAYGFFPFHGRTGWSSFPSGHTTLIAAPMAVLWMRLPRWRPILAIPVALVMVGLFGADYHFVGDMVAGLYLGVACAAGVLALLGGPGQVHAGQSAPPPPFPHDGGAEANDAPVPVDALGAPAAPPSSPSGTREAACPVPSSAGP